MPMLKLTGYHSHRHPFLGLENEQVNVSLAGEGDMIDLDNPVGPGMYEALAAVEEQSKQEEQALSVSKVVRPFVAGTVGGLLVYGLARRYKVTPRKAKQVAFVFGGIGILAGLASDYVYREMQALTKTPTTTT